MPCQRERIWSSLLHSDQHTNIIQGTELSWRSQGHPFPCRDLQPRPEIRTARSEDKPDGSFIRGGAYSDTALSMVYRLWVSRNALCGNDFWHRRRYVGIKDKEYKHGNDVAKRTRFGRWVIRKAESNQWLRQIGEFLVKAAQMIYTTYHVLESKLTSRSRCLLAAWQGPFTWNDTCKTCFHW